MTAIRCIATFLGAMACAAGAQSYTWTDITPPGMMVQEVGTHVLDGQRLIAHGYAPSTAMYSNDAGVTWNKPDTPLPGPMSGMLVDVALPGVVYLWESSRLLTFGVFGAPARTGMLYRSEDFGRTWSAVYTIAVGESIRPLGADPLDAHGIYAYYQESRNNCPGGCLVNSPPGLRRSHDDGRSWSAPLASPTAVYIDPPAPSAPARLFIGAYNAGTYVSRDGGASWSIFDSTLTWVRQDPQRADVLYGQRGSSGNYELLRSDDGGKAWHRIVSSGETPPVLFIDSARPNVLWRPYRTSTMYRSEDRGETWTELGYPPLPQEQSFISTPTIVPSPAEPGVVYLVRASRIFRGVPATKPEPIMVEYMYESDRYWSTPLDGEEVFMDYRQEPPANIRRTGQRWGAWTAQDKPADAVGSCRFWPKPQTGLRTRVLVLQGAECEVLRHTADWILEGENEFYAVPPVNGACRAGLVPVHRLPNMKADLNFRWATDPAIIAGMVARGWVDEGPKFCGRTLGSNE